MTEGYKWLAIKSAEGKHAPLPEGITPEDYEKSRQETIALLREKRQDILKTPENPVSRSQDSTER